MYVQIMLHTFYFFKNSNFSSDFSYTCRCFSVAVHCATRLGAQRLTSLEEAIQTFWRVEVIQWAPLTLLSVIFPLSGSFSSPVKSITQKIMTWSFALFMTLGRKQTTPHLVNRLPLKLLELYTCQNGLRLLNASCKSALRTLYADKGQNLAHRKSA